MLIYLAAAEQNWRDFKHVLVPLREARLGLLVSAHYLRLTTRSVGTASLPILREIQQAIPMVLDSGAFTFKMAKRPMTQAQMDAHLDKYEKLLCDCPHWDWVAEMDVDPVAPMAMIDAARARLERASPFAVLPVWHRNRGLAAWKRYCANSEYVAFSFMDKTSDTDLCAMAGHAYKQGCKVHAFGLTNPARLTAIPCYSCDSSSWISMRRYASQPTFNPAAPVSVSSAKRHPDAVGPGSRAAYLRNTLDRAGYGMVQMQQDTMSATIDAIRRTQKYLTDYWTRRGITYAD